MCASFRLAFDDDAYVIMVTRFYAKDTKKEPSTYRLPIAWNPEGPAVTVTDIANAFLAHIEHIAADRAGTLTADKEI